MSIHEAKATDENHRAPFVGVEGVDAADLKLVGLARLGDAWWAFVYGPGRHFFCLQPGDQVFDGRVRSIGPTGLTFQTDAGATLEVSFSR